MRHRLLLGCLVTAGLVLGQVAPALLEAAPKDRWATEQFFRVEAQPMEKKGKTVLAGYVHNLHYQPARVRLEIEGLDAQGNVVGIQPGFVDSVVPLRGQTYFEVPMKIAGATNYRAYVLWYDWLGETKGDFVRLFK
jgi:hypothetical protein